MPPEPISAKQRELMSKAIELATENVLAGNGGPFGAIVVKDGVVVATGVNSVTSLNDPTAHAEVMAIRKACEALGSFQLDGCEIYTSCEPCPMCMGALYWARPAAVYYAATQADAACAGFDDSFIYRELALHPEQRKMKMVQIPLERATESFERWKLETEKVEY